MLIKLLRKREFMKKKDCCSIITVLSGLGKFLKEQRQV